MEKDSLVHRLYKTKLISGLTHSQSWFLKRELKDCSSALDIGSGKNSPLGLCNILYKVGVDIFLPAIVESKNKGMHNAYVLADIRDVQFMPGSFDAVVLCEVIEHFKKEEGVSLLKKIEPWARKKILLSTPNGYLPQDDLYGNPHQVHLSGWDIDEFKKMGYKAYGMVGLRFKPSRFLFFPLVFWAVISVFAQWLTYHIPAIAFEIFYVKDKQRC